VEFHENNTVNNESQPKGISYLTGVERLLWGRTIERQYANRDSRYWHNVEKYGDIGSTYNSVGFLWLIAANAFVILFILTGILGTRLEFTLALVVGILLAIIASTRFLRAYKEGRSFRQSRS
jgi:hypothetical protein